MLLLELAQAQLLEEVLLQVEATAKPGKMKIATKIIAILGLTMVVVNIFLFI